MWWDRGKSLDYVVFGIGFGATILVLGLLIRDIGPGLRYRAPTSPDGVFHAEELVAKVAWTRFTRALGAVLAIGGVLFVIVTGVCMGLMVSDGTGGWVMIGSLIACLLLVMFWTWAFFDRFGSYGILPEREEAPEDTQVAHAPATTADPPAGRDAEGQPARQEPAPVAGPPAPEPVQTAPEAPVADVETGEEQVGIQTPEERLAGMQSPIEHGSAEDDLDMSAGGQGRPRRGRTQPPDRDPAPAGTDAADPDGAAGGGEEPVQEDEPERGGSESR